jgi:hypothetical protein
MLSERLRYERLIPERLTSFIDWSPTSLMDGHVLPPSIDHARASLLTATIAHG